MPVILTIKERSDSQHPGMEKLSGSRTAAKHNAILVIRKPVISDAAIYETQTDVVSPDAPDDSGRHRLLFSAAWDKVIYCC